MVLQMTKQSALSLLLGLMAVCCATLVNLSSARADADVYVIELTAPGIAVGSRLSVDATITIPQGTHIRAVLPSGKTQTVRGKFEGKVSEFAKGVAQNEGLMTWLKKISRPAVRPSSTTGATRGVHVAGKGRPFSWVELPSTMDATMCVQKGGAVLLTRSSTNRAERASLVDAATKTRGEVQWEIGNPTAPWPTNVALKEGVYTLYMQDKHPGRLPCTSSSSCRPRATC